MKDLLKISAIIALAWVLVAIPIFLGFSVFFQRVSAETILLSDTIYQAKRQLDFIREETVKYNEQSKQLRQEFLEQVEDVMRRNKELPDSISSQLNIRFLTLNRTIREMSHRIKKLQRNLKFNDWMESVP